MMSSCVACTRILWMCFCATVVIVSASFSNIHFEFNDAVNILNIDYPNDKRVFTEFADSVATRIQNEMIYDPKDRSMSCLPFNKTFLTKVLQPSIRITIDFHDGYIADFKAVQVASPISINKVEDTIFSVTVLLRFERFAMEYRNVTVSVECEAPRYTSAEMVFSNDSYIRLNMSFDKARPRSARLLGLTLPHYCVHSYEMRELPDSDGFLIGEMRPHIRHHFDTVEKRRLLEFLYDFFKYVVETTWFGEAKYFNVTPKKRN